MKIWTVPRNDGIEVEVVDRVPHLGGRGPLTLFLNSVARI